MSVTDNSGIKALNLIFSSPQPSDKVIRLNDPFVASLKPVLACLFSALHKKTVNNSILVEKDCLQ
ncbi:hypothetical protein C2W59_03107 [Bacillus pumilus]|nr:hypothetical protein C2W59_03107 [Bacillus pumilus]